jgi:outer membrane protein OmpA-like peptidoglycan-associated protein
MKIRITALFIATVIVFGQSPAPAASDSAKPVYQVKVVEVPAKAINYRNLKGSVEINFKSTELVSNANGVAEVTNKGGKTEIKAEFKGLMDAGHFGSEYLTYVFWGVSPDGRASNLGELIVKGGKSRLNAETPLQSLSLLVTAEPYFAVTQPSDAVVVENAIQPGNKAKIEWVDAKYELVARGQYAGPVDAAGFKNGSKKGKTPFNVYQARNAVRIARTAGAETYAAAGFKKAEELLALSETKKGGNTGRSLTAREAVQSAEDSRSLAVKRQAEEAVVNERLRTQDRIGKADSQAAAASAGQVKAEQAQSQAEQAQGRSDAERAAALSLAAGATAASAVSQADAKAARSSAEEAKSRADVSDARAQTAESEKAALRVELLQKLNDVFATRDTARGLIVNMSDALFQTGSSTLRPAVREKMAKIAGIVMSHPGLKLSVEGHTDSVGSDESNQRLSEKRAGAARDYLVAQGVPSASIVAQGFGKANPIGSNETPEGRQNNRRVEIVVSGEAIGMSAQAR